MAIVADGLVTLDNLAGGSILGGGAFAVKSNNGDVNVNQNVSGANTGVISALAPGAVAISATNGTATVANLGDGNITGIIEGDAAAISAKNVIVTGNTGRIEARGTNGRAIYAFGDATITNSTGTIRATGPGGIAIFGSNAVISSPPVNVTLEGNDAGGAIIGDVNAIFATGNVTVKGNNGLIEARGTYSTTIYAFTDASVTNGSGTITAGGYAIFARTGSVTLGGNNGLVEARGTYSTAVYAKTDAHVTNGAGTITGDQYAIYARTGSVTIGGNNGLVEARGTSSTAVYAKTDASVTNGTGTITGGSFAIRARTGSVTLGGNNGLIEARGTFSTAVYAKTDASVTNGAGTITGDSFAIRARYGSVTLGGNNGLIEARGTSSTAVYAKTDASVTNGAGTITGDSFAIRARYGSVTLSGNNGLIEATGTGGKAIYAGNADITNSKIIQAMATGGTAIGAESMATVHNLFGGAISGGTTGISAATLDITNDAGASIAGGTNAIEGSGTVRNAGTISGGTASVAFNGASGTNTLILQTGSKLIGDASGSTQGASNALVLQGAGRADNNFIGFNSLVMSGDAWGLNGSAEVGTASLNSGILTVGDGDHQSATLVGSVTANSGSTLAGIGTIIGDVDVLGGATIRPGTGAANQTLTVAGDARFAPGSTFAVNVAPDTASKLAVAGTAILTGGTVQVLAGGTGFAPSTQYTILTATDGLGGTTFGDVTSDLAFLSPTLTYDPNDVFLTLAVNANAFPSVAITPNQRAVAAALAQSPTDSGLVGAVLGQSAEGARQAFDALSGEVYASVHTVQAEDALLVRSTILDRLRAAAYDDAPAALRPLGYGGPALAYNTNEAASGDYASGASNDASGASGGHDASAPSPRWRGEGRGEGAYAADMAPPAQLPLKAPLLIPPRAPTYSFWAQGFGAWGHVDSDGNAAALKDNFAGFIAGVDTRLGSVSGGRG